MASIADSPFISCPLCLRVWNTAEELVTDPALKYEIYIPNFENPAKGRIYLTHTVGGCGSRLVVSVEGFRHLYRGPVYAILNKGEKSCRGLCLDGSRLESCDAACCMHWVREVIGYFVRHAVP